MISHWHIPSLTLRIFRNEPMTEDFRVKLAIKDAKRKREKEGYKQRLKSYKGKPK